MTSAVLAQGQKPKEEEKGKQPIGLFK